MKLLSNPVTYNTNYIKKGEKSMSNSLRKNQLENFLTEANRRKEYHCKKPI